MTKSIIVGSNGQDGTLLCQLLEKQGHLFIGLDKNRIKTNQNGYISDFVNIRDFEAVCSLIRSFQPDEIYYLAAFHHSAEERGTSPIELWKQSCLVNTDSLLNFLEGIRLFSPNTKLFYAASSHIFGTPYQMVQDENTPFNPITIYGITKATGIFLCRSYREVYGVFVAAGILYNHESVYRSEKFISSKIIRGAIRIKRAEQDGLVVGNLSAVTDWGYAPDYVDAMQKILALSTPEDFVIATGERHTVQEFIEIVFQELGLDWQLFVEEKKDILAKQSPALIGNAEKLWTRTGWRPTVGFNEMVRRLVSQHLAN